MNLDVRTIPLILGFSPGFDSRGSLPSAAGPNSPSSTFYSQQPYSGQNSVAQYNQSMLYTSFLHIEDHFSLGFFQIVTDTSPTPLTMQYTEDEVPCTLYLIRPGSRRIVSNTTNGQRVTWILQVPPKPGYVAIPNCISIVKCPITQLNVNYLNTDQSLSTWPNGSVLQFMSAPNMNDMGSFPEHVPAQMLQVNIDGVPPPLPPATLEVHMIICYEPMSQSQVNYP